MAELSEKRKRFCEEYLIDLNGTQAAIRAGYKEKGARVEANRLLTNANIQEHISHLREKQQKRTEVTADKVVEEIAKLAFTNIQDYYNKDFEPKDLQELNPEQAVAVESVKKKVIETVGESFHNTNTTVEFKLANKLGALDKLARYVGIYEKDNQQKSSNVDMSRLSDEELVEFARLNRKVKVAL